MLELKNIRKKFNAGTIDETTLFTDFNLTVETGEFISVIGSNGSGKTTLLNLICGSLRPDGGSILFDGRDVTRTSEYARARLIGRVLQDPKAGTCPNLTILENLSLADNKNKRFGLSPALNKRRLDDYRTLLERCNLGLENRLNVPVGSLSGGQRQALALVIANMADIKLLILDEHTAALDPKTSETIMELTDQIVREKHITTLMVTHNLRFALQYGSRLIMMHEGYRVMDLKGAEKQAVQLDDVLVKFNEISIECGN